MADPELTFLDAVYSEEFYEAEGTIPFLAGISGNGDFVIKDLAQFPNLLIAGATGTGKSTFAHGIILSMMERTPPDRLNFIFCDTKIVEFPVYGRSPHLLIPVATDTRKINGIIQWAWMEISRRLRTISDTGCRDISSYNELFDDIEGRLPRIVFVIDDIANVTVDSATRDIFQNAIQNAKPAGFHFILITQTPSSKAIINTIRSSIPVRAVFNVFSNEDEKLLLGARKNSYLSDVGEIIFCDMRSCQREKIRCFWVDEKDINTILENQEKTYAPEKKALETLIIEEMINKKGAPSASIATEEPEPGEDELLPAAVDVILETGQASVSMLQRRLKLGYARSAQIMGEMEEKGIVGPFQGSNPRAILVTREQWVAMNSAHPTDEGVSEYTEKEYTAEQIPEPGAGNDGEYISEAAPEEAPKRLKLQDIDIPKTILTIFLKSVTFVVIWFLLFIVCVIIFGAKDGESATLASMLLILAIPTFVGIWCVSPKFRRKMKGMFPKK